MKKMLALTAMILAGCVCAMKQEEESSEMKRVTARPLDIVLREELRSKNYQAASAMINTGLGRSAQTVAELKKPKVAEGVAQAALQENQPGTLNALIAMKLLTSTQVNELFTHAVMNLEKKSGQNGLLALLKSNARQWIDVNRQVDWNEFNQDTVPAIGKAASLALLAVVQALIDAGANPNIQDSVEKNTPLLFAIKSSLFDRTINSKDLHSIITLLLEQPTIDLSVKDIHQRNAEDWVTSKEFKDPVIRDLILNRATKSQ